MKVDVLQLAGIVTSCLLAAIFQLGSDHQFGLLLLNIFSMLIKLWLWSL